MKTDPASIPYHVYQAFEVVEVSNGTPFDSAIKTRIAAAFDALIDDEFVAALAAHLQSDWAGPYMARVADFTREEVLAGKLRAADREAEAQAQAEARRALEAALAAAFRPR